MPTKAQIQQQIDALTAQMDDADTDDEVWVKDETGREVKVTGKRATSILDRFADLWKDDDADAGDGDKGDKGDGDKDDKPAGGGYFGRRK